VARADDAQAAAPAAAIETAAPEADEDAAGGASEVGEPGATAQPAADESMSIDESLLEEDLGPDPAERDLVPRWNRRVFALNEAFLHWVMRPVVSVYQAFTPKLARQLIVNGFENLESPVILANDLMQLDPCRAARTVARFVLNTAAGVGGLVDVAAEMGLEREDTDFGETLGRWGVRSGTFIMLPLLGPSTARDTFGELVDTALRPEIWLLGGFPRLALTGGDGLSTYDIQAERLDALRETSLDFYAALRSAYLMDRDARIEKLRSAGRCGFGKKPPEQP
jgi:phospholipid-binding lipoprotein MlaA